MTTAITFDILKFMERLKKSGVPQTQAKAIAKAFAFAQTEAKLATQSDLKFATQKLTSDMKALEYRLIIKFGTMLSIAAGLIVTLGKIL